MFRHALRLLSRNPYEVLGVTANATPKEIKARYKELARIHHPDMPSGDANKFREVHAAYQLLKSGKGSEGMRGAGAQQQAWRGPTGATNQRYYGRKGKDYKGPEVTAEDIRKMKEEAAQRKANHSLFGGEHGTKLAVGCGVAAFIATVMLYRSFTRREEAHRERIFTMMGELDASSRHPTEFTNIRSRARRRGDDDDVGARFDRADATDIATKPVSSSSSSAGANGHDSVGALPPRIDASAMQRRYDDLRDYFYTNDPDNCTSRRYTTQRVLSRLLDETRVPERCPIVVEVDIGRPDVRAYDEGVTDVVQQRLESGAVRFANVDAEVVALHGAIAVGRIPKHSVANNEWTFVEYRDTELAKSAPSTCLVAIRNKRIAEGEGFAQRILITGSEELQPALLRKRQAEIATGRVDPKSMAVSGIVPTKLQQSKGIDWAIGIPPNAN